jgi:hypothetical protein
VICQVSFDLISEAAWLYTWMCIVNPQGKSSKRGLGQ